MLKDVLSLMSANRELIRISISSNEKQEVITVGNCAL